MASSSSGAASSSSAAAPPPPASGARKQPPPPSAGGSSARTTPDPILRNTLRYTISAREYALLHKYVLSRNRQVKKRVPSVERVNRIMNGGVKGPADMDVADVASTSAGLDAKAGAMLGADDFNARALRHALRVFGVTAVGMKLYGLAMQKLGGMKADPNFKKQPFYKSPVFRLSLSLSSILFLYRVLFRFFTRLRLHLLDPNAAPFRKRNPKVSASLTSPYAPAIGASLAGLALGAYPAEQLRTTVAIYAIFQALGFAWNHVEDAGMVWGRERNGKLKKRPWWFGSWIMQPFAFGQLLHAFVFDADCFPEVS